MTLSDEEIQSRIIQFIAGNSGCNVRTMVQALASRLFISPSTISMNYKLMIYDEKTSPDGSIIVEKPSGFRGGNEPFKLTLRQTDLKKDLDHISKNLDTYEKQFHTYFPDMRKGKLMITKKTDGVKYQMMRQKHESDFDILCSMIDWMFNIVAGLSFAKNQGYTPKEYNGLIDDLQKRTMTWIIKSITHFLDQQSKTESVTRWNILIQFRTRLKWLLNIETKKPDLFIKREWLRDGVIY
jgi:hypothetical protein